MPYIFSDVVDIQSVQSLMDNLWNITGISTSIIDVDGTVLVASGWQDICTQFHRQHPETNVRCLESDSYLAKHLNNSPGLPECGYIEYTCRNGMMNIGIPIVIEGRHLANIFLGQFFYAPPDEEFFRHQARRFGFDESDYLAAVNKVPIFSRHKVIEIAGFNTGLVGLLTRMGIEKIRQLEAQSELQESEGKFRNLFESSNDTIYIVGRGGQILEANHMACEHFGFSHQELLQKTMPELLTPDEVSKISNRIQEIQEKGRLIFEAVHVRKGNIPFAVEVSVRPFTYQGQQALLATSRDITDRKRAEAKVQESERRLATLMSNLTGMVYRCRNDQEWTMEFVSNGCRALTGHPPEDLIENNKLSFGDIIHPEDHEKVWQQIQVGLRKNEPFQVEYRIRTAADEERWVLELGRGVSASGGGLVALEGFITDITERKKAEEILRQSDRMKSEFIKTVAHEFRTPLTSIQGFSEVLLTHDQLSPEVQRESLRYIYERSVALADMVDDILDIARIEAGRGLSLKVSPCLVMELFRQVEPFLKIQGTKYRFEVNLAEKDLLLEIDKRKMGQVLVNLLSNAIKFSPEGSLVQIRGDFFQGKYRISIADQGVGMTQEQAAMVFDKFYRIDASDTAVEGIGLGMSIVKHIVEAHGEKLWVKSELGKGTTVSFTLPLTLQ